jgi:trehalose 6-phosphate synthase
VARLRLSLQGAKLAIGADRVDYSKGLANRIRAFDRLLTTQPSYKGAISFLQIAVPSRGTIPTYCSLQAELSSLVGEINGRHGEVDWTPIRYLNKGYSQATLAGFYRTAHIGVVTPLHDGMNLVAKEYVAAQNPFDPGVLVLSNYAGAARQLDSALLVNPHDVDDIARAYGLALRMSLEERRERWETMMKTLRRSSVHTWFANFVAALARSERAAGVQSHSQVRFQDRAIIH